MGEAHEFEVVLQSQPEGGYSVYVPDLPGCISEGETKAEALDNIQEAIAAYLESLEAHGDPLPPPVERARITVST